MTVAVECSPGPVDIKVMNRILLANWTSRKAPRGTHCTCHELCEGVVAPLL